jgi:Flp pilus assembly protein TadG
VASRISFRWRRLARGEHGSTLIEFGATAGILAMTMFGLMTMCQGIYTYHYVSEAAREGTRFAAVRGSTCSGLTGGCPAASSDIQTYVQNLGYPGIKSSLATVTTTWAAYPTGTTCAPSTTCNNPGNAVKVKVQYAFPLSIPYLGTKTLTMTSTSDLIIWE